MLKYSSWKYNWILLIVPSLQPHNRKTTILDQIQSLQILHYKLFWSVSRANHRTETSLLLWILICFSGCLSVCFSLHSISALVHVGKITDSTHKLEEHNRGKQHGSHFHMLVEWWWGSWESLLYSILLWDWLTATLHHYTKSFFSISLYNSFVLYFFYRHKEEGIKRKGRCKERTLSCIWMATLRKYNCVKEDNFLGQRFFKMKTNKLSDSTDDNKARTTVSVNPFLVKLR